MLVLASIGGAIVLLDPEFTMKAGEATLKIGGGAFSDEMRGGVVTIAIIGTITGLVRFWLPGSETPPSMPQQSTTTTTTEVKQ